MTTVFTKKQAYERRLLSLKQEHNKYIPAYQELSTYINPTRGIFNGDRTKVGRMIDHKKLLSSYGTHALRIFASGLNSGMTSKSSEWFRPTYDNPAYLEIAGAKEALDELKDKMYSILNQSNIYNVLYQAYEEMGQFGPACYMVLEDFDDVVRGRSFTAGEYYLGTDSKGRVNTFGREFEMTVEQLILEFGYESCSLSVQALWDRNDIDSKIKVSHLIEENNQVDGNMADFRGMPFRSIYWESGNSQDDSFLAVRGFKRFPVIAPRWDLITTDDVYGYSPGWHAIGAIKELQKTRYDKLLAQEKYHNPPMMQDSSVTGHYNKVPGGVTKTSSSVPNSGVWPAYQIELRMDSFIQALEECKDEIDRFYFVNLFLMLMNIDKTNMTATEVAERQQEKIMMMGPALHRLDEEMLTPMLTLVYGIMEDNGLLPLFPEELQGQAIKIEYTSILAQAQKALGINKIERVLGIVGVAAQMDPSVLDVIDFDEVVRNTAEMEGARSKIVRDKELVASIREQKAQQQEAMMALQSANSAADTASKLSNAKTTEPSVLNNLIQGAEMARSAMAGE